MRILIVTGRFPVLSQNFITNKVIALAKRGHDIKVVASSRGEITIDRKLAEEVAGHFLIRYLPPEDAVPRRMVRIPWLLLRAFCKSPAYAMRLIQLLRSRYGLGPEFVKQLYRLLPFAGEQPDVLHFEWSTKAANYLELIDLLPCRKVISCRGSDIRIMPLMNAKLAESLRWLFARVDRVHCVSHAVLGTAEKYGLDRRKAFINYPSVDINYFSSELRDSREEGAPIRFISTGRLHWVKGFDYALKAIQLIVSRGHDVSYTIIGDGDADTKAQLLFAIQDLGLQERVRLLGSRPRDEVRSLLAQSDVFILSSLSEGLSNSALEAMAMGLPVVSTNVGGMCEAIRDGFNGYLVPSREPQIMADRLEALVKDQSLRTQMGKNGRHQVLEKFAFRNQISRFIECYENLLLDRCDESTNATSLSTALG